MFWTKIHLQPDLHEVDRNDTCKSTMILYSFDSGSTLIFIVYQMGRLCGGAHEISGVVVGVVGWVVVGVQSGEGWWVVWLDYLSNRIQILKNWHFGVKENHCPLNEGLEIWKPKHFSFVGKGQT